VAGFQVTAQDPRTRVRCSDSVGFGASWTPGPHASVEISEWNGLESQNRVIEVAVP
jgi:hypothetical protein